MEKDAVLIQRMKRGDKEAHHTFVKKYYPLVLRYCCAHVSDRDYAEDLTQATFENFYKSFPRFAFRGKTVNYLYVIAGNLCRNYYKKKKEYAIAEPYEGEETDMEQVTERLHIEKALQRLPEEYREVIILRYFQELKLKEIAEVLEIGMPAVRYQLNKAKELLAQELKEG